jgi:hypothetical protein
MKKNKKNEKQLAEDRERDNARGYVDKIAQFVRDNEKLTRGKTYYEIKQIMDRRNKDG